MSTQVIFIRHGETEWNASGRWQGHAPVPLNDRGIQQAQFAATYLIEQPISHVVSSDLQRAYTTAEIIADELGLTVMIDKRLREFDLGNWQGLTLEEVEVWDTANLEKFRGDPFNVPRPGGESSQQVGQRCYQALVDYVHQYPNATLLFVSHGGTINSVLQTLFPDFIRQGISNTSLTQLYYNSEEPKWSLVAVGETPHLPVLSTEHGLLISKI